MPSELRKPSTRNKSHGSLARIGASGTSLAKKGSVATGSLAKVGGSRTSLARVSAKPSHTSLAKLGSIGARSIVVEKPSKSSLANLAASRTSLANKSSVAPGSLAKVGGSRASLAKLGASRTSLANKSSAAPGSLARASTKPSHMSLATAGRPSKTFQSVANENKSIRGSNLKSLKGTVRSSGIASLKPSAMPISNKEPSGARFTLAHIEPELMPIAESIIRSSAATDRGSKNPQSIRESKMKSLVNGDPSFGGSSRKTFQSVADQNKSIRESKLDSIGPLRKTFQSVADENKSIRDSKVKSLAGTDPSFGRSSKKSIRSVADQNKSMRDSKFKSLAGTDPSFGGSSRKTFQSVADQNKSIRDSKMKSVNPSTRSSGVKTLNPSGVSTATLGGRSRASTRMTLNPSVRASMLKSINPSILTFNTESAKPSMTSVAATQNPSRTSGIKSLKPSTYASGIRSLLPSKYSAGRSSAKPSHISLAKSYASSAGGSTLPRSLNPSINASIRENSNPPRVSTFTSGTRSFRPTRINTIPEGVDPSVNQSIMQYPSRSGVASLRPSGFNTIPASVNPSVNQSIMEYPNQSGVDDIRPSYYASTTESFMPSRMDEDMVGDGYMDQSYFSCDDNYMPSQMSEGMSFNPSQSSATFGNFQEDEKYDPEAVEVQEEMANACFDNQKLLNDVFFKLAKEFERISDEIDGCIETSYKAFDMIDPIAVMNEDYFEEEYNPDEDLDGEYDPSNEYSEYDNPSVRFSHKTLVSDDLNNPEVIPFGANPASTMTQSQSRNQYGSSVTPSQYSGTISKSKSRGSTNSIAKSIMTAQSHGGSKSVASLNKTLASSIMSGKSLADTTKSIDRKVLQKNKSIDASESVGSRARSLSRSQLGSIASRSLNQSLRSSAGRSVGFRSRPQSLAGQSIVIDEPVSLNDSLPDEEPKSLGRSMMSGIKSIMSQGKSMVLGSRDSSLSNQDGNEVPNTSLSRMNSQSNADDPKPSLMSRLSSKISSLMGSRQSSVDEENRMSGTTGQSQNTSVMSKIKSFFTRSSNNEEEEEMEYSDDVDLEAVQNRYVDLWGKVISKLELTSAQFKALSEMTKSVAMVSNEPFEIPIMELPTHADGQPLSADELIHALHNTMIPNKQNQSKIHSLIINLIVAHCEIRNAETFLDELCQKIEIPPKHLKSLTSKRIYRTKLIVKQCGNELIANDVRYENYVNAYYEALDHNYPPALGTLEDPPLKHSPTCPEQIEIQRRMICDIREQYIYDKINAFNELVSNWLLDYTTIAVETTECLAEHDKGL